MKLFGVLLTQVGRRQVCAAAKPGLPLHLHQDAVEGLNKRRLGRPKAAVQQRSREAEAGWT